MPPMKNYNSAIHFLLRLDDEKPYMLTEAARCPAAALLLLSLPAAPPPHRRLTPPTPPPDTLPCPASYAPPSQTSSHKYGLFNDTVLEAEVILSSGEVVICSKTQNRELFDALPWSYGTLGFLASVTIKVLALPRAAPAPAVLTTHTLTGDPVTVKVTDPSEPF
jgi:hypothetical protein